MVTRTSKRLHSTIFLLLLVPIAAISFSVVNSWGETCTCNGSCQCSDGSEYFLDPTVNLGCSGANPCDIKTQCNKLCASKNLGNATISGGTCNGNGCTVSIPLLCPSERVLGEDDPRLEILRQFRDEVLARTETGRKLIDLYYQNEEEMTQILEEHPAFQKTAKDLLELIIPVIEKMVKKQATSKRPVVGK